MRQLTAVIHKEGRWFVSENPETGVASQGRTEKDALENLREAVGLYLEEVETPLLRKVIICQLVI